MAGFRHKHGDLAAAFAAGEADSLLKRRRLHLDRAEQSQYASTHRGWETSQGDNTGKATDPKGPRLSSYAAEREPLRAALHAAYGNFPLPNYAGFRIWFGDDLAAYYDQPQDVYRYIYQESGGETEPRHAPVLAAYQHPEAPLRAEIVLSDEKALFAPQRSRTRRVALVIGAAAAAAGAGWLASWRAFKQQVALAAMKDNFASSVSHELRAPIASIQLMAESLASGRAAGEDKGREYARLIAGECARLGSLVENVLAFSRLESGREAFEIEECDAGAAARAAADLMRPVAAQRGIEIEFEDAGEQGGELAAKMDARWVTRALVNLIDNAVKYGPPDQPVAVRAQPLAGGGVRFTVADGGDPIPAAERARIFERFYRRGSELTRETQGVGIGLSLVQRIAELHGGAAFANPLDSGNEIGFTIAGA
ncbi:MAG: HAMP domain-containing sensor histidine kinase [Verrucomicrobiales bacterium]